MQEVLEKLEERGANLVALTPTLPEYCAEMIDKHSLNFHLLTDPGNEYAAKLGLTFKLSNGLKDVYQELGIDLPKFNGDDSWTLPLPARLVVDSNGIVRASDVSIDHTRRPDPEKTVEDVIEITRIGELAQIGSIADIANIDGGSGAAETPDAPDTADKADKADAKV